MTKRLILSAELTVKITQKYKIILSRDSAKIGCVSAQCNVWQNKANFLNQLILMRKILCIKYD